MERSSTLFSRKEICEFLGVGKHTFYRLVKEEGLPARKGPGGWRADKAVLDAHMRQSTHNTASK